MKNQICNKSKRSKPIKILILSIVLMIIGCSKNHQKENTLTERVQSKNDSLLANVIDFPVIKDTANFIAVLRQILTLDVNKKTVQKVVGKITTYKKVKIYGSDKDYIIIEYDYGPSMMASYPWKNQLILTTDGNLVKVLSGDHFDFVTIFSNQNPFLLILNRTARGNGNHEIYKISADTLENVYDAYGIQTYDSHEDHSVFEPSELNIAFIDNNKDGFNDIVFTGQIIMLGKYTKDSLWYDSENGRAFSIKHPACKVPIKYVFIYDRKTEHFIANDVFQIH